MKSIAESLRTLVTKGLPLLEVLAGKKAANLAAERARKARVKAMPERKSEIAGDGGVSLRHLVNPVYPNWDAVDWRLPYERWAKVLLQGDDGLAFLKYLPRAYRKVYLMKDGKKKVFAKGNQNRGIQLYKNAQRHKVKQEEFFENLNGVESMWRWYAKHLGAVLECIEGVPFMQRELDGKPENFRKLLTLAMWRDFDTEWDGVPLYEIAESLEKLKSTKEKNLHLDLTNLGFALGPCFFQELTPEDLEMQAKAFRDWRGCATGEYTVEELKREAAVLLTKFGRAQSLRDVERHDQLYYRLWKYDQLPRELSSARLKLLTVKEV